MKHTEMVRKFVAHRARELVTRCRSFVSATDGNTEAVDRLTAGREDELAAVIVEQVMVYMGASTELSATDPKIGSMSKARRAVSKVGM